ncbi:scaffolding protein [Pelagibacter phage HTVC048P]|nr:scaffolding protein [Pelagibacter phage HTVC021P]WMM95439.1 scaffolding protein [Pelagibacter phage HTVC048P]
MVETITVNKEEETTSEKPVEEQSTQSKPEGLPEKFNSVEDLAKSYSELEKKLGEQTPKEVDPSSQATLKEDAPKEQKGELDIAEKAVASAGLNMENLSNEYAEKGELDAKSYEALEKAGIPKDYVDQFIEGQKAIGEKQTNTVKALVGGNEAYSEMADWAADNLTDAEKTAYNTAVNSKDLETAKLAVVGLKAKFEKANGSEPTLLEGQTAPSGEAGYKSWAEVTRAMSDDRYQKDPAYQAAVKEKLSKSEL